MEQLQSIKAKLNGLDHRCNELRLAIDEMQAYMYSYQYNIKIFGLPTFEDRENSEPKAKLCQEYPTRKISKVIGYRSQ